MRKRARCTRRLLFLALALVLALQAVAWAERAAPPVTVAFPNIYNAPGMKTRYTNGECVILETADGKCVILDTGSEYTVAAQIIYERLRALQKREDVYVDYMIVSHLDGDHYGNAVLLMESEHVTVGHLIIKREHYVSKGSYFREKLEDFDRIVHTALARGVQIISDDSETTREYMREHFGDVDYGKLSEGMEIPVGAYLKLYLFNTGNVYEDKTILSGDRLGWTPDFTREDLYQTEEGEYVYFDARDYPDITFRTTTIPAQRFVNQETGDGLGMDRYFYATYKANHVNARSNVNALAVLAEIATEGLPSYAYFPNDIENGGFSAIESGGSATTLFRDLRFEDGEWKQDITPERIPSEINAANAVYEKLAAEAEQAGIPVEDMLHRIVLYQMAHHGYNNNEQAIARLDLNRGDGIYAIQDGGADPYAAGTSYSLAKTYFYTLGDIPADHKIRVGTRGQLGTECRIEEDGSVSVRTYRLVSIKTRRK